MKQLGTVTIDRINILLMLVALVPAFLWPFQTFLFVYAFLGPLHYLTEINWLHQKNYFTSAKHDYLFIVGGGLIISAILLFGLPFRQYISVFTFSLFSSALGFVLFKTVRAKALFTLIATLAGATLFLLFPKYFRLVFSTLMPTLVHVFIFTGMFILVGALKSGSKTGMVSLIVFAGCALIALFAGTEFNIETVTKQIHYSHMGFFRVNKVMLSLYNAFDPSALATTQSPEGYKPVELPVYFSDAGIRAMRFIAFAYTYHYLNWFSKTSVIQWHNTKTINLVAIMIIWAVSVVVYIVDYNIGLRWLFALSFGHVLLEFPLNHRSFIEVKQRLFAKFSG